MATKKKIITVRIKTPDAISELNRIVKAKFKPLKADLKKGVFIFTYRYGLQTIKVNSIVRAHKGITVIQIVAKTDDLIGTGGKKAISILESELKKVEPKYLVDYEIEIAFQKILKGDYIESYNTLKKASKTRPKTFKLNYGLALCYVAKNEINKAREYIYRALAEINQTEQIVYRKRIAVKLFKLKRFQLSSEIFEQVYEKEKSNKEIALFYFNLLLKSGDLSKLFHLVTKEFKNHPSYLIQLLKYKSITASEKETINSKLPILIKSIRKNTVFNLTSPSLVYLLQKNISDLPLRYRKVVNLFYKKQEITYSSLIKLYNEAIALSKSIQIKSIEQLSKLSEPKLNEFKKQVNKLNKLQSIGESYLDKNKLNKLTKEINETLNSLESSKNFTSIQKSFSNSIELSENINDFINTSKVNIENTFEVLIIRKDIKNANNILLNYKEIYSDESKINSFTEKLATLKKVKDEESKKKRKYITYGAIVIFSLIAISSLAWWLITGDSNDSSNSDIPKSNENIIVNSTDKPKYIQINGENIWVRSKARTGEVVMKLNNNPQVKVLDSCCLETIRGDKSYWYKIEHNGQEGWLFGSQTKAYSKSIKTSITEPKQLLRKISADKSIVKFHGFGTEPFWDIYFTNEEVLYIKNDESNSYKLVKPFDTNANTQTLKYQDENGNLFEIKILKKLTGDGMSEKSYPYSVIWDEGKPHLNGAGYIDESTIQNKKLKN
jgi:uncharacterized membrane protein